TNVSPSHLPIENPCHAGQSTTFGSERPSVNICRNVVLDSYRINVNPGIWTIFSGVASVALSVTPVCRQRALGSSVELLAWRSSNTAFAHGWKGMESPALRLCATLNRGLVAIQMPDKSGLPLAARGRGAVRFGFPFAVRGSPGVGKPCHCRNIAA